MNSGAPRLTEHPAAVRAMMAALADRIDAAAVEEGMILTTVASVDI